MSSRSRRLIDLVVNKKTEESPCDKLIINVGDNGPDSPVRCAYTDAEWKILNDIYDDVFVPSSPVVLERHTTVPNEENTVESDSENIILDSTETTPVPSPTSAQDFYSEIQQTEISVCIQSVNSLISLSESEEPNTPNTSNRIKTYKTDPGRKRKRHVDQWIDVRRKLLTNTGKKYISKKGKTVLAKRMKIPCPHTCKLKCTQELSEEIRQNIFKNFWKLANHTKQWEYINKFTKRIEKKRKTTEGESRRKYTTKYFLPFPTSSSTYEPKKVCLKMFCATLAVTDQFIRTAHIKLDSSGITREDNRGTHSNHPKKIDAEMIRSVCDHVKSFQPVESHYTRKSSNKLYLDNTLTFSKMFSLYREWPESDNYNSKAETERQYRTIINDNMNIAFFIPKKDLCDKCHAFTNLENPTEDQKETHAKHISNKELARKYKANDKEQANKSSSKIVCATYDFQKVLNCPYGEVSLFYYKRKLSLMHFTVFDTGKREASCYLWPENVGKRGANEVASCVLNFINKKIPEGAEEFRFWSDNCAGQNRNRVVYSLYMYACSKYNVNITHRFLESGHTQQEADSVHALIERSARGKIIYTPDQWYGLVRWAKTNKEPYHVTEVSQDMLFDFKILLENRNWKKNSLNEDVKWNNIKEIHVKKDEPNVIFYKYDFDSDYLILNTLLQTRRNKKTLAGYRENVLTQLYSSSLPISNAKYKDLVSLCNAGHIPKNYHDFYKNLKVGQHSDANESDDDDE